MIAVSLGGEGEPVSGADFVVNANLFEADAMVRPDFATQLGGGHLVVATSAGALGLRDGCADLVVARHFPIQFNQTIDGFGVDDIAHEAFRIAKPGGILYFSCSSCDLRSLAESLTRGGFTNIVIDSDRYSVRGRRP
jgi:hypothetical protein